jgi:hypothetical protein
MVYREPTARPIRLPRDRFPRAGLRGGGLVVACVVLFQSGCVDYIPFRPQDSPGDSAVVITLKNGDVERFEPPVVVDRDGETLVFRGATRPPLRISERDIAKLEASKPMVSGATITTILVVAIVLSIVTAVATYSVGLVTSHAAPG